MAKRSESMRVIRVSMRRQVGALRADQSEGPRMMFAALVSAAETITAVSMTLAGGQH